MKWEDETNRIAEAKADAKKRKRGNGDQNPAEHENPCDDEEAINVLYHVPGGCGWPHGMDRETSGLPLELSLVMKVDMVNPFQGDTDLVGFTNNFGPLPARATMELTSMLYKTAVDDAVESSQAGRGARRTTKLPMGVFLPPAKLVNEDQRARHFCPAKDSLEGFQAAGTYLKVAARFERVLKTQESIVERMDLLCMYMSQIIPQFKPIALSGAMLSTCTMHTLRNLQEGNDRCCRDLRSLVGQVLPLPPSGRSVEGVPVGNSPLRQPWARRPTSYSFWRHRSNNKFLAASWAVEQLYIEHNKKFFHLSAANLKILNDTQLSSIMYRLGQQNVGITYIGFPVVVCDGAAELQVSTNTHHAMTADTMKQPSAGYDFVREVLDTRRTSHFAYNRPQVTDDDSKIMQMKKITPGAFQIGYVTFDNQVCVGFTTRVCVV